MSLVRDGTSVFFNPAIEGRVIHGDAALGHDLFEVSAGNTNPKLEIDRVQDHSFWAVRAFETDQIFNSGPQPAMRTFWASPHPNAMAALRVCDTTLSGTIRRIIYESLV